jgi:hypothetical protein
MSKDKMTYSGALEIVLNLSNGNQIDEVDIAFGDGDLGSQRKWQQEALKTLEDMLANHSAEIDQRYVQPAKLSKPNITMVAADRSDDPARPLACIKICLDLARDNVLDDTSPEMADEVVEQELAITMTEDFIVRHGGALDAAMTTIKLPPSP